EGGCQHMTCTNSCCSHEFCWLCLRAWKSPDHDGLRCALSRLDGASAEPAERRSADQVLAAVEAQIDRNFDAQPKETRPARREDYAAEVRRRFGVALVTELASDKEMLGAAMGTGEGQPLLLSLWLLRLYERREREARHAANLVFCEE
ncbi:unnamed protein product, partial [Polarella glacialis]